MIGQRQSRLQSCDPPLRSPRPVAIRSQIRIPPAVATPPTPAKHRRHFTPSLVVAVVAHVVLAVLLAIIPLRYARDRIKSELPSVSFTFVGMAAPGNNPKAGGRTPIATAPKPAAPVPKPKAPAVPPPPPPLPVVFIKPKLVAPPSPPAPIAVVVKNVPAERVIAATPAPAAPVAASVSSATDNHGQAALLVGDAARSGSGTGNGTGNGVGDGTGSGAAGIGGNGPGGSSGTFAAHPDYLHTPKPRYPSIARQSGWEGTTVLRVEVRKDGTTGLVEVLESSGHHVLDEAARDSVRAAKFIPARAGGAPTNSWVEVPISFRLNRG